MLKSLRSRLLLSYVVVILVVLVIAGAAMLAIVAQPQIRFFASLQRLDAISQTSRNELVRLMRSGANSQMILTVLDETAVENQVRILILEPRTLTVRYDSHDAWLGETVRGTEIPQGLLPSTDNNTAAIRYHHPNGSNWLIYTRALTNTGFERQLVVYAVPEPTPLAFFENLGIGRALFRGGIAALVVALLLGFWIARSVARPLQKMAGAAEGIAQGNYDQQLALQGPEEVKRVAASFNLMSTEVARTRNAHRHFVANVSHDLKTPVTSIRGWSQALLDGTAVTPEDQQHAAGIINMESERMTRMVDELLDLARLESGQLTLKKEKLDVGALLHTVYSSFLPRAQDHEVHLTIQTEVVPRILGDQDRLIQVFSNLLDNALSHTPATGRIHLSLVPHGERAVEVSVQDTGKGIPAEDLSRIFERFYQVDKSRTRFEEQNGSGLGLAIVHELVLLHHGRVLARSEVGKGSVFIVRLPVTDQPEASTLIHRHR